MTPTQRAMFGRFTVMLVIGTTCIAAAPGAQADVLDEVIAFYNPDLRPARPAIECALAGKSIGACAADAATQQVIERAGGTINQVLDLMGDVQAKRYDAVVLKAGVVAACAWVSAPGKEILCSDIGGKLAQAGAQAAQATASVANEAAKVLAETVASVGKEFVCFVTGCHSGGSGVKVTIDANKTWTDCFASRLNEGVRARTGGAPSWLRLVNAPVASGLFPANSLAGRCWNPVLGSGSSSAAGQLQVVYASMLARYRDLVESAAAASLDHSAGEYQSLQSAWQTKADQQAAQWFTTPPLGLVFAADRKRCREALEGEQASAIARWADAGNAVGSPTELRGRDARAWKLADNPDTWCQSTYVPLIKERIAARQTLHQQALATGCAAVDDNPRHLRCAAMTSGLASCQQAFAGATNARCEASMRAVGPMKPVAAPPAAPPPAATAPAAPAPAPTPAPAPPRLRIPLPTTRGAN